MFGDAACVQIRTERHVFRAADVPRDDDGEQRCWAVGSVVVEWTCSAKCRYVGLLRGPRSSITQQEKTVAILSWTFMVPRARPGVQSQDHIVHSMFMRHWNHRQDSLRARFVLIRFWCQVRTWRAPPCTNTGATATTLRQLKAKRLRKLEPHRVGSQSDLVLWLLIQRKGGSQKTGRMVNMEQLVSSAG